ncbi:MAG: signal peptide peptidase SppA [Armatimonadota bacterium]|nr:signal peptide peptidase SppA [bacterium]
MNDDIHQPQPEPERPSQASYQGPPPPPPGMWQYVPYSPPPQPRSRIWIPIVIVLGCLFLFSLFGLALVGIAVGGAGGAAERGPHVALIRVDGVITAGTSGGSPFGSSVCGSEDMVEQLERARTNPDAKAIVIRINSPGGSAAGSEEVYNEIKRVRESGKVVYTSMGDVAASGGYYIAAPCTKIFSDANSITGSIGVIFSTADMSELYKKIGYRPEVVKSGKFKDIGSSSRALTPEERSLLQEIVNMTYINFVTAVSKGRKLPFDQVKKISDGRVFTGGQAMKLKLVDEIGGLHETIRAAGKAGGIKGAPKTVEYGRKGFLKNLLGGEASKASGELDAALARKALELLAGHAEDSTY